MDSEDASAAETSSDDSNKTTDNDEDESSRLMFLALEVAAGKEIPSDIFHEVQRAAEEIDHHSQRLHAKYILCGHAAQHYGFVEPDYFGNLPEFFQQPMLIFDNALCGHLHRFCLVKTLLVHC